VKLFQLRKELPQKGEHYYHVDHEDTRIEIISADKRTVKFYFLIDDRQRQREMSLSGFRHTYQKI
jgi:hypothetical protein